MSLQIRLLSRASANAGVGFLQILVKREIVVRIDEIELRVFGIGSFLFVGIGGVVLGCRTLGCRTFFRLGCLCGGG